MSKRYVVATGVAALVLLMGLSDLAGQVADLESKLKSDPSNPQILLSLVRHYHGVAAENGDGVAVEKAEKYLNKLLELQPDNAEAMVYYGSLLTIKARDAGDPSEALDHLQSGFTKMDKAVQIDSGNPVVRLVRGVNSLNVPDQFGRFSIALEDFKAIAGLDPKMLAALGPEFLSIFHFHYGAALLKNGNRSEAVAEFRRTIETGKGTASAERAKQQLALLEKNK